MYKWAVIQGLRREMEVGSGRGGVEISEAMSGVKSSGETQVSCLAGGPGELRASRSWQNYAVKSTLLMTTN